MYFSKNNISNFEYPPFGRRILKISKPCSGGVPDSDQTTWTFTYYVNDASGNVMATYDYKRTIANYNITLDEQMIYGSSRLGMRKPSKLLSTYYISGGTLSHEDTDSTRRWCGKKRYEYTNHLGNVLLVTTDRKISVDTNSNGTTDYYHAVVDAYYDYGPFGNVLDGRSGGSYRYGFNGTEGDEEMYNNKSSHDFGARMYNSDLGRFFSADPLSAIYAWKSPYAYAQNNPIRFIDLFGLGIGDPITSCVKPGGNLMIIQVDKENPILATNLENTNWSYVLVYDLRDAATWMQNNYKKGTVENMYILTHGSIESIALHNAVYDESGNLNDDPTNIFSSKQIGEFLNNDPISYPDNVTPSDEKKQTHKELLFSLAEIGSYLKSGANILFTACYMGLENKNDSDVSDISQNIYTLLTAFMDEVNSELNIYLNSDASTPWSCDEYTINNDGDTECVGDDRRVLLNQKLSRPSSDESNEYTFIKHEFTYDGWRDKMIQTTTQNLNMMVTSKGEIKEIGRPSFQSNSYRQK